MGILARRAGQGEPPRKRRFRDLPVALRLYIAVVAAAALLAGGLLAHDFRAQLPDLPLALLLLGLLILAKRYQIHLAPKLRVSTDTAVLFAAALLFHPSLALPLAALGSLISNTLGRRPWFNALFNAAQTALSTGLAALVYLSLAPGRLDEMSNLAGQLPALVLAAAVMYAANALLVDTAAGLQQGQHPLVGSWQRHRSVLPHHVALFLLGILPAVTARTHPWTLALVAVPVVVIHIALRDMVRLRVQTREAVEALADMVDLRDPYTHGHSQRVASYAALIAKRLGLSPDDIDVVTAAARVHDIGKIAVPDRVLLKPDRLTDAEYREMQRHQEVGARLLERFPDFSRGRQFVWAHHERPDGRGYGRGLRGSEIPLGASIIAVADSFDAMTSDRPYRSALPLEMAIAELRRYRGQQWDARVVDAFLDLLEDETPDAAPRCLTVARAQPMSSFWKSEARQVHLTVGLTRVN